VRKECEGLSKAKQDICNGNSDLPDWKINAYRQRWGLEPLSDTEIPKNKKNTNKPIPIKKKSKYGPGTELIKIYKEAGVPPCNQCYELADKMNEWGVEGCKNNIDAIIEDILPRAKRWVENHKPWVHKLLPNLVKESAIKIKIKSDIQKAIANAEKSTKKSTTKPIKRGGSIKPQRGCGCGKTRHR